MIRRLLRRTRNRRQLDVSNVPQGATVVATPGTVAGFVNLALNQPCSLDGIPQLLRAGVTPPIAAVMTTPTNCRLTFSNTVTAGVEFNLADRDPALRSYNGGFVAALAKTF